MNKKKFFGLATCLIMWMYISGLAVFAEDGNIIFEDKYAPEVVPVEWSNTDAQPNTDADGVNLMVSSPIGDSKNARAATRVFDMSQGLLKLTMKFKVTGDATKIFMISNSTGTRAFSGFIEGNRFYHNRYGGQDTITNNVTIGVVHTVQIYLNTLTYSLDVVYDGELKLKDVAFFGNNDGVNNIYTATYNGGTIQFYEMKMEKIAERKLSIDSPKVKLLGEDNSATKLVNGTYICELPYKNDSENNENVVILMCLYEDDMLVKVTTKSAAIGVGGSGSLETSIEVDNPVGRQLEVFVWKNLVDNRCLYDGVITLAP